MGPTSGWMVFPITEVGVCYVDDPDDYYYGEAYPIVSISGRLTATYDADDAEILALIFGGAAWRPAKTRKPHRSPLWPPDALPRPKATAAPSEPASWRPGPARRAKRQALGLRNFRKVV